MGLVRTKDKDCREGGGAKRIGLISDTHGLLRPEALAFLAGCDRIVHAGDICDAAVLEHLATIAPLIAVRGNNDIGRWADALPLTQPLTIDDVTLYVVHDVADLATHPAPADATIIVHGHSHKPAIVERDGRRYVNPGSAGPRRFKLPISIGELAIEGARATPRLVTLVP